MKIGLIYLLNMHSCLIVNSSSSVHVIINYYKIGVQNQNITRVASKTTLDNVINLFYFPNVWHYRHTFTIRSTPERRKKSHATSFSSFTQKYITLWRWNRLWVAFHVDIKLQITRKQEPNLHLCCDFISHFIKPRYEFITYDNTHFHKCIFEPAQYPVFCFS